jgi:hypothetical protein
MSKTSEPEKTKEEGPTTFALPDFYTDPNAVLNDTKAVWRFGRSPNYAKTRSVYAECEHISLLLVEKSGMS